MTRMHLSLRVSDLARSVAFYEAFLGRAPHKIRPGYANFEIDEPPLKLALNQSAFTPVAGPLDHLGFQMATVDDVHRARTRLQAAGLATFDETDTTCCYAKQDKIWVHDPDGNEWEVYALTDDLLDDLEHDHLGNPLEESGEAARTFRTIPRTLIMVDGTGAGCCTEVEPGEERD